MKRDGSFQMLKYSIKRNRVKIIVLILAIIASLAIGGYAGVQAYYHDNKKKGWFLYENKSALWGDY